MLKFLSVLRGARVVTLSVLLVAVTSLPMFAQHFTRTDLTVDLSSVSPTALNPDPNLKNSWGLTRSATSAWWVSDNHTGLATLYDGVGARQPLVVTIPTLDGSSAIATPTGTAFNYGSGFEIAPGKKAIFLFVTEDGTISGWNPGVKPTDAVIAFPPPGTKPGNAVYKGCTLVTTTQGTFLYVSNFGEERVDVFDSNFHPVSLRPYAFRDLVSPVERLRVLADLATAFWGGGRFQDADATNARAAALLDVLGYAQTQQAVVLYNNWALTLTEAGRPV